MEGSGLSKTSASAPKVRLYTIFFHPDSLSSFTDSVFRAVDLIDKDHTVLVKTRIHTNHHNSLENEYRVLQSLRGLQGIPDVLWSGMEYEHHVLVFEDLGPTLDDVLKSNGRTLPTNTIAVLAEQLVS